MGNIMDDIAGKITPISKKEVDEFKLLVAEASFLTENREQQNYSTGFPPELAAAIGGLGAGAVGIGVVFAVFAGMSGPEIMSALAGFGVAGAGGGIASIAAVIAAPVVVVGGSLFHVANQKKLGDELGKLVKQSYKFEKQLTNDNRYIAKGLVKAIQEYRNNLENKHHDLKKIKYMWDYVWTNVKYLDTKWAIFLERL